MSKAKSRSNRKPSPAPAVEVPSVNVEVPSVTRSVSLIPAPKHNQFDVEYRSNPDGSLVFNFSFHGVAVKG